MTSDPVDNEPMPSAATRNLFLWASGFGLGALVVLFGFLVLIGIGELGQNSASSKTPATQSAANAPAAPGPSPRAAPQTGTAPETSGQAPTAQPSRNSPGK